MGKESNNVIKRMKEQSCRLRIDPLLVDKFRRLPGGINEVGVKIVRDFGLSYNHDKQKHTLDILGPDTEILSLAIETLRFWVEDDEYPHTGVTCQVGYPNRHIIIWRFHGDYAKKFDHLFQVEISRVKCIPTVNIKAIPSKRRLEYVELYCHFSVYHQVKDEVMRFSSELSRIYEDDFFVPKSDHQKARQFAKSKGKDTKVLYAIKEYPAEDKIRVWIFSRDQPGVIRAKKEWLLHVGAVARDTENVVYGRRDIEIKSASFFGNYNSAEGSETVSPVNLNIRNINPPPPSKTIQTTLNLSTANSVYNKSPRSISDKSPRNAANFPKYDNPNFPRPSDFVYPVRTDHESEFEFTDEPNDKTDPFLFDGTRLGDLDEDNIVKGNNPLAGQAKWEVDTGVGLYKMRRHSKPEPNRIYVHQEVGPTAGSTFGSGTGTFGPRSGQFVSGAGKVGLGGVTKVLPNGDGLKRIVHPETNLIAHERFKPTSLSKQVLTTVTDPNLAPSIKKGNRNVRPGAGKNTNQAGKVKVRASTRSKPQLKAAEPPPSVRYHINVNGLDIYMYSQSIAKLDNIDALVNAVNVDAKSGGASAMAVFEAGGKQVKDEVEIHTHLNGPLRVAENIVTTAGRIPALGILHVAGPIWEEYTDMAEEECARDLHTAVYRALKTAESHHYRRVGLPIIGAEPFFGVPKDLVSEVYVKALVDYSMGMGPMYPVLEIHLVDTDTQMLTYIKDAYERWAANPAVQDMALQVPGLDSSFHTAADLSSRAESAVSMKGTRTHRSQNMVTFVEQSYTEDGNQKWTFDILKILQVHVYTGSVVRQNNVEGIVIGVDGNMKGSLAKQAVFYGDRKYEYSLHKARGSRVLREGEVVVCDGGDLDIGVILHSVVSRPIYTVSQANLSRLDTIYTHLFYAANKLRLKSLAMPLVGTGRLREKFEVEQCSLQMVDNIIEVCLGVTKLSIKELHLVNVNPIMTQCLTQALRTRAHTKVRMETEPHLPSRQEVLIHVDQQGTDPDLTTTGDGTRANLQQGNTHTDMKVDSTKPDDDVKSRTTKTDIDIVNAGSVVSKPGSKLVRKRVTPQVIGFERKAIENKQDKKVEKETGTIKKIDDRSNKAKASNEEKGELNYKANDRKEEKVKNDIKTDGSLYLSENNLKQHEKRRGSAWTDFFTKDEIGRKSGKTTARRRNNQLEPLNLKDVDNKSDRLNQNEPKKDDKIQIKPFKARQRPNIPKLPQTIFQRSRAESYKSMYERKQQVAKQMEKEGGIKVRRSQSQSGIKNNEIGDNVLDGFKKERKMLDKMKKTSKVKKTGGGGDDEYLSDKKRDEFLQNLNQVENFYTRNTKDRYKSFKKGRVDYDAYEKMDRVAVNERGLNQSRSKTERIPRKGGVGKRGMAEKGYKTERNVRDNDREDMYMMDMGYEGNDLDLDMYDSGMDELIDDENLDENDPKLNSNETARSDKLRMKQDKSMNMISGQIKEEDSVGAVEDQGPTTDEGRSVHLQRIADEMSRAMNGEMIEAVIENRGDGQYEADTKADSKSQTMKSARITRTSAKYTDSSFPETDLPPLENMSALRTSTRDGNENLERYPTDRSNVKNSSRRRNLDQEIGVNQQDMETENNKAKVPTYNDGQLIEDESPRNRFGDNANRGMSGKDYKSGRQSPQQSQRFPKGTSDMSMYNENHENNEQDKAGNISTTITGINRPFSLKISGERDDMAHNENDVTIRDKLNVEIDIVDKNDPKQIKKEKEKIKRFWNVVGESDKEEADMFLREDNKGQDKVVVAKVTKERKMSSKSRGSKKSQASAMTQKLGNYNVTVEVGN